MNPYIVLWLILMVILFGIEAATVNLVSIWFALGALGALIAAIAGGQLWLQVTVFVVVAAVTLLLTRPVLKKRLAVRHQPTNADKVYELPAVVTERIDNEAGTGAVSSGGKIWTARSADCVPIEAGTRVKVLSIEGVKLIVTPEAARVN
ncbi:MAG: NfeD family protein [Oscillospiraceae bacterium]|jgi:membrane protein implicated in regulation of membrane protease activity|nr:NfeD family protein [Oscillospiraceae bacterium]